MAAALEKCTPLIFEILKCRDQIHFRIAEISFEFHRIWVRPAVFMLFSVTMFADF